MLILHRMETLKRHLPFSGHEGLQELKKIAVRFEEKIYTAATSQVRYACVHLFLFVVFSVCFFGTKIF